MPEIINCPGCGAEISDDCGNCLLCGKEIKAGGHTVDSTLNKEMKRESGTEKMSGAPETETRPAKKSAFNKPSGEGNFKDGSSEAFRSPGEDAGGRYFSPDEVVRPASLAASICMLVFSVTGFSLAVAISFVIGIIALFSRHGGRYGGAVSEQYVIIFAFAFLAANAITGGNFGYRAGRYIARALGMDVGGGPGPSSSFLWGGYAGGFLCAVLFSVIMPPRNNYGGRDGEELLFVYFFVCVIAVIAGIYMALAKSAKFQKYRGPGDTGYAGNFSAPSETEDVQGGEPALIAAGRFRDISGFFVSALLGAYVLESVSVQFVNRTFGFGRGMVPSYVWFFIAGAIGAIAGMALFANYSKTELAAKENGGTEGFLRDTLFLVICALIFSAAFRNLFYFFSSLFLRNIETSSIICGIAGMETIGAYIGVNFGLAINRNLALNFSKIRSAPQTLETMLLALGHGFLAWLAALMFSYMAYGVFYDSLTVGVRGASAGYYLFHFAVTVITSLAVSAGMYYGITNQKRK